MSSVNRYTLTGAAASLWALVYHDTYKEMLSISRDKGSPSVLEFASGIAAAAAQESVHRAFPDAEEWEYEEEEVEECEDEEGDEEGGEDEGDEEEVEEEEVPQSDWYPYGLRAYREQQEAKKRLPTPPRKPKTFESETVDLPVDEYVRALVQLKGRLFAKHSRVYMTGVHTWADFHSAKAHNGMFQNVSMCGAIIEEGPVNGKRLKAIQQKLCTGSVWFDVRTRQFGSRGLDEEVSDYVIERIRSAVAQRARASSMPEAEKPVTVPKPSPPPETPGVRDLVTALTEYADASKDGMLIFKDIHVLCDIAYTYSSRGTITGGRLNRVRSYSKYIATRIKEQLDLGAMYYDLNTNEFSSDVSLRKEVFDNIKSNIIKSAM